MKLNQRDLVLIPFPFSNLVGRKVRPALIVSNEKFNSYSSDLILVPLTSIITKEKYSININQSNLVSGHLIKPSLIKMNNIFTIDRNKIVFKIGQLDKQIFNKVKKVFYRLV